MPFTYRGGSYLQESLTDNLVSIKEFLIVHLTNLCMPPLGHCSGGIEGCYRLLDVHLSAEPFECF